MKKIFTVVLLTMMLLPATLALASGFKYRSTQLSSPGSVTLTNSAGLDYFVRAVGGDVVWNINGGDSITTPAGNALGGTFNATLNSPTINILSIGGGGSAEVLLTGVER